MFCKAYRFDSKSWFRLISRLLFRLLLLLIVGVFIVTFVSESTISNVNAQEGVTTDEPEADVTGKYECDFAMTLKNGTYLGGVAWSFYNSISWCYDGTKIISIQDNGPKAWIEPIYKSGNLLTYEGVLSHNTSGGEGRWSYSTSSQGKFQWPGYAEYPTIRLTIRGDGTWSLR